MRWKALTVIVTSCWDRDGAKAGHRAKVERRKLRRMKRREKGGGGGIVDKGTCGSLESHIKRLMDISANNSLYWLQKNGSSPISFPNQWLTNEDQQGKEVGPAGRLCTGMRGRRLEYQSWLSH